MFFFVKNTEGKILLKTFFKKGFSTVELICVVTILLVLVSPLWKISKGIADIPMEEEAWRDIERYSLACRLYMVKGGFFTSSNDIKEKLENVGLFLGIPEQSGYEIRFHMKNSKITVYVPLNIHSPIEDTQEFPLYNSEIPGSTENDIIKETVKRDHKGDFFKISIDNDN